MASKDYIRQNRDWLAARSHDDGVMPLPKGCFYRVLHSGDANGACPSPRSIVTVHYTGRTIDGSVFDSSRGGTAPAFRLSDLIEGWTIALTRMHCGDRWELYIPAEMGYGRFRQPGIPGGSTLVFDIELISIA